jgi:hypothetical protein
MVGAETLDTWVVDSMCDAATTLGVATRTAAATATEAAKRSHPIPDIPKGRDPRQPFAAFSLDSYRTPASPFNETIALAGMAFTNQSRCYRPSGATTTG